MFILKNVSNYAAKLIKIFVAAYAIQRNKIKTVLKYK